MYLELPFHRKKEYFGELGDQKSGYKCEIIPPIVGCCNIIHKMCVPSLIKLINKNQAKGLATIVAIFSLLDIFGLEVLPQAVKF